MERIGKILLKNRTITEDQLKTALEYKSRTGYRLGHCLTELRFISEENLLSALSGQTRRNILRPGEIDVDPAAFALLNEEYCLKNFCLPYRFEANLLCVAMPDPTDGKLLDDIRFLTGRKIRAAAALETVIIKKISEIRCRKSSAGTVPPATDDSTVLAALGKLLADAFYMHASDLHLERGERSFRVRYRIDGVLEAGREEAPDRYDELISAVKIRAAMDITERRLPQDGSFRHLHSGQETDVRVSVVPGRWGESCVLRFLARTGQFAGLKDLGLESGDEKIIRDCLRRPQGLILVTGPTGSGKTTTLYSMLRILDAPEKKILTIEDPVEYDLGGVVQVEVRSEIGLTFAEALKYFLRHDPDIIMVGEIRDSETARIAVRAALTGHLVLSTMHTNDSVSAFDRLRDMGVEEYLLDTIRLVLAQRLVRKWDLEEGRYRGRTAIFEILDMTEERKALFREGDAGQIRRRLKEAGFHDLADRAGALMKKGVLTREEFMRIIGEGA